MPTMWIIFSVLISMFQLFNLYVFIFNVIQLFIALN